MHSERAIEFGQEAVVTCLTLTAPILIVGIVVAILMGILQAMTQVQDQTVSFVPKIVLVAVTFVICLPWLTERLVDYSHELFAKPTFVKTFRQESVFEAPRADQDRPAQPEQHSLPSLPTKPENPTDQVANHHDSNHHDSNRRGDYRS